MRENVLRLLAALLIVVLSLGAPLPAQADCLECDSCTTEAPASDDGCQPLGLACQLTQNCFGQMQNLAAPASAGTDDGAAGALFAPAAADMVRSAFITPETAPPRL